MYDVQGEGLTGERKGFVSDVDSSIILASIESLLSPSSQVLIHHRIQRSKM
jgi:hypothetical protein